MEPVTNYNKTLGQLLYGPIKRGIVDPVANLFNQRAADTGRQLSQDEVFSPNWPKSREEMKRPGIYLQDPGSEQGQAMEAGLGLADVADIGMLGLGVRGVKQGAELVGGQLKKWVPQKWMSGKREGRYRGGPNWVDSPYNLKKMKGIGQALATEGAAGRYWYEDTGKQIIKYMGGNVNDAEDFVKFLAVTSSQTGVQANLTHAMRMYSHFKSLKAGKDTISPLVRAGRFPVRMYDEYLKLVSGDKQFIDTIKRGSFYKNLMTEIDPSRFGKDADVTVDMWMMRALGYDTDVPGMSSKDKSAQYDFVRNHVRDVAKNLGWEAHQVQAAMWTSIKARSESKVVKDLTKTMAKKRGIIKNGEVVNMDAYNDLLYKNAMKHEPSVGEIKNAAKHYGDFLKTHHAFSSTEYIPSINSGILPELHKAPYQVKVQFTYDMQRAMSPEGVDEIASYLGIPSPGGGLAGPSGHYVEAVGGKEIAYNYPTVQKTVTAPLQRGTNLGVQIPTGTFRETVNKKGEVVRKAVMKTIQHGRVEPSAARQMDQYAAMYGEIANQDSLGWYRLIDGTTVEASSALHIKTGQSLQPSEVKEIMSHLEKDPYLNQNVWTAPSPDGDGIYVFHIRGYEGGKVDPLPPGIEGPTRTVFDHTEFVRRVGKAAGKSSQKKLKIDRMGHDGNLIGGPHGKDRMGLLQEFRNDPKFKRISGSLTERARGVYQKYAKKHGWNPSTIPGYSQPQRPPSFGTTPATAVATGARLTQPQNLGGPP